MNGTVKRRLKYTADTEEMILNVFCDSDFGEDMKDRISTSGYVMFLSDAPIEWSTKKQSVVAQSSTEAEYIAAAHCCKQMKAMTNFIEEIPNGKIEVRLYIDNQSTIKMIKNGQLSRLSNHIDIKYHFVHDEYTKDWFKIIYCPTENNSADLMTKSLNATKFEKFASVMTKYF